MRSLIFRILYSFGFLSLFPLKKGTIKVLCFHRVSSDNSPGYKPLSPSVFEKLISKLSKKVDFIDFDDIESRTSQKPAIIITFDDAFKDFEIFALPVIKKFNAPVTLNVISSCAETGEPHWTQKINCLIEEFAKQNTFPQINGTAFNTLKKDINEGSTALEVFHVLKDFSFKEVNTVINSWENELDFDKNNYTQMLKWLEIKNILNQYSKTQIGNHTSNHINLKYTHDQSLIDKEVLNSHRVIEEKLNCQINRFAFPNGEYNAKSIKTVVDFKYKYIQLTEAPQETSSNKSFYRIEPFFNSFEENLFKIHGFHDFVKRK